jgi:hypothetical protein
MVLRRRTISLQAIDFMQSYMVSLVDFMESVSLARTTACQPHMSCPTHLVAVTSLGLTQVPRGACRVRPQCPRAPRRGSCKIWSRGSVSLAVSARMYFFSACVCVRVFFFLSVPVVIFTGSSCVCYDFLPHTPSLRPLSAVRGA